jgi:hypothetical protein
MSDYTLEDVKQWVQHAYHDDELEDLGYVSEGDVLEMSTLPEGYSAKVVFSNTKRDYDSYGYQYLEDGYIVFSITDSEGDVQNFKFPIDYASYEGWSYDYNDITPTTHQAKVVTTWEWV